MEDNAAMERNNKRPRRKKRNHSRKPGKAYNRAVEMVEAEKMYDINEACELVKKVSFVKFDASIDMHIRLGVDPRQANENIRGTASLPHGTGKKVTVLVLTTSDKEQEAKDAGADMVGLDEYIEKIKGGWTDVDVIVCSPDVMPKVGALGRILGPRGLMPNPKSGTVTPNVGKAVEEVKAGKIDFRVDKAGIIHTPVGKSSFSAEQLKDNAVELLQTLHRMKPSGLKGVYFKGISLAPTMGPGVGVDKSSVDGIN
ncbi:MAG: 50S ribosomal protein L1 [Bacteroidia bacterium]